MAKVECDVCKKRFNSPAGLRVHIARTHGPKRIKGRKSTSSQNHEVSVDFCPRCGLHIAALTISK